MSQPVKIGLKAIGLHDNQDLKNALINCDDPLKAISDFQDDNSIHLPTLKPALNLLDLHTIKRLDFHLSIAEELKDHLVKRVEKLALQIKDQSKDHGTEPLKKLEDLLDKTFPLICSPRLTNMVLLIMKLLPKINPIYLNYINENEAFYTIAPMEVKRQIWSLNADVFVKELQPIFEKITLYLDELLTTFELNIFSSTPHTNIDAAIIRDNLLLTNTAYTAMLKGNKKLAGLINDVIKLIGSSHKLYSQCLSALSKIYLKTHNWFYSTMRSQLLIKLHEVHNHELINSIDKQNDTIFKFSSIINLCLKEKRIDTKRAKELETIMESKKFEKIIPEVAFVLSDPFVVDMLARNAMSFLNRCVQNELLPRNCTELIFALRLLYLSLYAKEIMKSASYKEPNLNGILITEYLPNIAYFLTDYYEKLYDDSLQSLTLQCGSSKTLTLPTPSLLTTSPTMLQTAPTPTTSNTTPTAVKKSPPIVLKISTRKLEIVAAIKQQISENELCSVLFIYLILACIEIHDWTNFQVLLPAIKYPENNTIQFEKWFIYQFFNALSEKQVLEQFGHEWFVTVVFDEFLFAVLNQKDAQLSGLAENKQGVMLKNSESLYEQIYKLLDKIYPSYLLPASFFRIIETLKPKKLHSSNLHISYLKLRAKLDATNDTNGNDLGEIE